MKYEKTGNKTPNKKALEDYSFKGISTSTMLWHIVRRHKFALVSLAAILGWSLYLLPFWPGEVADLISSL